MKLFVGRINRDAWIDHARSCRDACTGENRQVLYEYAQTQRIGSNQSRQDEADREASNETFCDPLKAKTVAMVA